ncbi:hypothetical protein JPFTNV_02340 [Francisella tularensis subsp. holarctica]|nr:hypothetical protein JPFTNV_02340 [Francisella tularensis subsp. holarctica]BCL55797.1 hypothetical protein JPFTKU_16110 [Francisella tularensis subsp. holarctica]
MYGKNSNITAKPQVTIKPANKSPAPKKPLKIAKYYDTVNESTTPKSTKKPTMICT